MNLLDSIKIKCKSEKEAQNIYNLLKPEMQKSDRFSSNIERLKNIVVINIIAKDAVGSNVYWPELQTYTLDTLNPGKSYFLNVTDPCSIIYPD